jgi:DNA-binding Lrp family transcriptional regulator
MGGVLQAAEEGRSMRFAYVLIKVERGCVHDVANQLIELEEVSEVHSISGPHDLMAKVMVPTYDDLGATIPEKNSPPAGHPGHRDARRIQRVQMMRQFFADRT